MIIASITYKCRWRGKIVERGVVFNAGEATFHRFTENSLHLVKEGGAYSLEQYTIDCVLKTAKALAITPKNLRSPWLGDMYDREVQYGLKIEVHSLDRNVQLRRRPISDNLLRRICEKFATI